MSDDISKLANKLDESSRQARNSIDEAIRQVRNENDALLRQVRNENEASFRQLRREFQDANDPSSKPDPSQWAKSWAEIREDFRKLEATIKELGGEVASSKKEGDAKLNTAVSALKTEANVLGAKITQLGERAEETPTFGEVPGALLDFINKHWRMIITGLTIVAVLVLGICKLFVSNQDNRLAVLEKTIINNDQRMGKNIDALKQNIGAIGQDLKAAADQPAALELRINKELVSRESHFYEKLDLLTDRVVKVELLVRDRLPSSEGPNSTNKSGVKSP